MPDRAQMASMLDALIAATPLAMIGLTADRRICLWNRGAEHVVGVKHVVGPLRRLVYRHQSCRCAKVVVPAKANEIGSSPEIVSTRRNATRAPTGCGALVRTAAQNMRGRLSPADERGLP